MSAPKVELRKLQQPSFSRAPPSFERAETGLSSDYEH
jgi:hypothetical protein